VGKNAVKLFLYLGNSQNHVKHISIRPATDADLPEILAIVNHAIANTTAIYDVDERSPTQQRDWFTDKTSKNEPVIIAEFQDKVVGFGAYGIFKPKVGYRFSVEHSVYVHHEQTGQGIGKQLLSRLIEIAKSQRIHTMVGYIDSENTGSIAFHKQFGFVEIGVLKEIGFKFGRRLNVSLMQLMLD
jgi:L-amino acid N-acyltransferase